LPAHATLFLVILDGHCHSFGKDRRKCASGRISNCNACCPSLRCNARPFLIFILHDAAIDEGLGVRSHDPLGNSDAVRTSATHVGHFCSKNVNKRRHGALMGPRDEGSTQFLGDTGISTASRPEEGMGCMCRQVAVGQPFLKPKTSCLETPSNAEIGRKSG
jgi:hypothetical protein